MLSGFRFYRFVMVLLLLVTSLGAVAKRDSVDVSNPQSTIRTHLAFLQDELFYPDSSIKAFHKNGLTKEELKKRSVQLKQIFDGRGYFVEVKRLPSSPNYKDTLGGGDIFVLDETQKNIYLEKYGDQWLYSMSTIDQIPSIHKEVYPYGTDRLLNMLHRLGHDKYIGLYIWQFVGLFILLLLSFILQKVFSIIIEMLIAKMVIRFGKLKLAVTYIRAVAKPFSLLIVFVLLTILIPVLQLPIGFGKWVILGTKAAVPLFCMLVAFKMVDVLSVYLERLAERTENTMDDQLIPLLRKALKAFVIVIGVVFILQNLDFDVTALIAGISLGGLAIALAAQDTLKNFFGSLMIFIDRPFQIGDWVTAPGIDGDIEEVGFRSTRIRTFHNSLIYVPNGHLADMTVDNMGKRKYRRYKTMISVTYDTPPHLVDAFVEGLRKIVENHPDTRKDYYNVYLNTFGGSSLDILFYIFFAVPSWPAELKARHEVNLDIMKLADKLGVRFAFPTQTVHVEDFPGKPSLTPQEYVTAEEAKKKLEG